MFPNTTTEHNHTNNSAASFCAKGDSSPERGAGDRNADRSSGKRSTASLASAGLGSIACVGKKECKSDALSFCDALWKKGFFVPKSTRTKNGLTLGSKFVDRSLHSRPCLKPQYFSGCEAECKMYGIQQCTVPTIFPTQANVYNIF